MTKARTEAEDYFQVRRSSIPALDRKEHGTSDLLENSVHQNQ